VRRDIQTPGSGSDLTHYESLGVAIAVPIGPSGGAGQFPGQDEIVGRETISERKGREVGVDQVSELFGLATPAMAALALGRTLLGATGRDL
jgi:hypothetical protein